jgi:hypothetical protein
MGRYSKRLLHGLLEEVERPGVLQGHVIPTALKIDVVVDLQVRAPLVLVF